MKKDTTDVLRRYVGDTGVRSARRVATDFDLVARNLPPEAVTSALSEAFRSGQTRRSFSFAQIVGFAHAAAQDCNARPRR